MVRPSALARDCHLGRAGLRCRDALGAYTGTLVDPLGRQTSSDSTPARALDGTGRHILSSGEPRPMVFAGR